MRIWRIARLGYGKLDGDGAQLLGGRWNAPGTPLVYTSMHLSLAALEVLVHVDPDTLPTDLHAFEIEVPDHVAKAAVDRARLPIDWADIVDHPACRELGSEWMIGATSAVLFVPSAVVPLEMNCLINPVHPDAWHINVVRSTPFTFDLRLLRE